MSKIKNPDFNVGILNAQMFLFKSRHKGNAFFESNQIYGLKNSIIPSFSLVFTTKRLIYIKKVYPIHPLFQNILANIEKCPYLCIVFFIVLDLRLTKGWDLAKSLFLCP